MIKVKHIINLHKGLTAFFIVSLMVIFQNYSLGPWVYLALHGSYGFLWLLKDRIFPDKQWEQEIPTLAAIPGFLIISLYWLAPYLLISNHIIPPLYLICIAITLNMVGVFLHFSSDAQKYYTLKYHPGLISDGFFARCRNTNYLGEILIYIGFALLAMHWLPFLFLALMIALVFVPNMLKKDRSLARYPEFAGYKERSGLLFPSIISSPRAADQQPQPGQV